MSKIEDCGRELPEQFQARMKNENKNEHVISMEVKFAHPGNVPYFFFLQGQQSVYLGNTDDLELLAHKMLETVKESREGKLQ